MVLSEVTTEKKSPVTPPGIDPGTFRLVANRWLPLTAFSLKILDNVSSIGRGAGIAASSGRGSTSKGTKVSNFYKYFK